MSKLILPPLRRTAADAAQIAAFVHGDQVNETGEPITTHLARVAAGTRRLAESCSFWAIDHRDDAEQVAWLHKVIGAKCATARVLRLEGFSQIVIEAVSALTRPDSEAYHAWIERIAHDGGLTAILVKLASLNDALGPKQLAALPKANRSVAEKQYRSARMDLVEAAHHMGWQASDEDYTHLQ